MLLVYYGPEDWRQCYTRETELCGGVVRGFITLLGPTLYSRKSARDKLEGIKKSLIVLEYIAILIYSQI